ncbi:hypothetical protein AXG93_793s1140 [Marchantia polymorpha subsp. ruderalis]|uniref:WPP domain-containing protein n=1 Tax=Marchantia polymorpha subsp. ruderalis TaxID=1480154 RepID=A0A176W0Q4_MARPO|nr:hypothetical protein AXG93_793s1140 [Marchantia polymorpha subsp. ruderalis]
MTTMIELAARGYFIEKLQLMIELDLNDQISEDSEVIGLGRAFQQRAFLGLEILALSDNKVDEIAMTQLLKAVQMGNLSNLRELHLYNSELYLAGADLLAEALKSGHLSKLELLDMSHNNIGDRGLIAIADALSSGQVPELNAFSIGEKPQGKGFHSKGAEAVASMLKSGQLPRLEVLRLCRVVEEQGMIAIIQALESGLTGDFKALDLFMCEIGLEASKSLAKTLRSSSFMSLSLLCVCDSPSMGDEGVSLVLDALSSGNTSNLKTLQLSNVQMRDEGWAKMAGLLEAGHLPHLVCLNGKDDAPLSETSAQALAKAYQTNNSLNVQLSVVWPNRSIQTQVRKLQRFTLVKSYQFEGVHPAAKQPLVIYSNCVK